jgi:hypothetical protein
MSSRFPVRYSILLLLILLLTLGSATAAAKQDDGPRTVTDVTSLGMVTVPHLFPFEGTAVGGLSGITYDAAKDVYYALSDDRTVPRYYTLAIDVSDGSLDPGDVTFLGVTFLHEQGGEGFEPGVADPEGINLARQGQLFISSEGDANASPAIDPFVNRFTLSGRQNRVLLVPDKFLPDGVETFGIRDNQAFESLTSSPDGRYLYTATENALHQDGPASTLATSSPSRLLVYDLAGKRPGAEYVYIVAPIPKAPEPAGAFADNGLVELQALDNHGNFLAMERSFAVGVGNTVVLFEIGTKGATDVSGLESLMGASYVPMPKRHVADFEVDLGIDPDNLEGMAFGPALPDGRMLLIVVSDDNFNAVQTTQFIALAVSLEPAG